MLHIYTTVTCTKTKVVGFLVQEKKAFDGIKTTDDKNMQNISAFKKLNAFFKLQIVNFLQFI